MVNVVSVAGTVALAAVGPYTASKHAQLAFSRAVARRAAPRGIRVHTILPGLRRDTRASRSTSGFSGSVVRRIVAEPELVAERVVAAVEHDRREVFVPRFYRVAQLAQTLAPRLVELVGGRGVRPAGD